MAPLTNSKSTPTGLAGSSSSNSSSGDWTHTHITTTFFWVGEPADSENDYITNVASAWDDQWQQHFGGADTPQSRNGWWPAAFKPKENPFYIALPYNDFDAKGKRKASAQKCLPTAVQTDANRSWCKNSWVMIRHNGQVVYAQWEDAGPLGEDDVDYVFGNSAFRNTWGAKAGLDVSPAVHDYLHLQDVDTTDWSLVPASKVPDGPWKQIVTQ
ncbi:MAG TPA: hypothetical protein VLF60_02730 [Candidatus Saccharimonadales bacterium]|nr:hypothetical protein [Candidatus Saccharimonadales bacterium]